VKLEASEAGTGLRILVEEVKQTEALLNATQLSLDAARAAQGSGLERKEALVLEVIATPCRTSVLSIHALQSKPASYIPLTPLHHQLRRVEERVKEEAAVLSRTEVGVADASRRLRELKGECQRTEESFDRSRGDVVAEERKLQHLRRTVSCAETELRDMEAQVKATSIGIERERTAAVQEVIELGATKQLVQSRLLSMAEAQRRLDGEHFSSASVGGAGRGHTGLAGAKASHPLPSAAAMRNAGDTGAGTDTGSAAAGPVVGEAKDGLRLLSADTPGVRRSMDYFSGAASGGSAGTGSPPLTGGSGARGIDALRQEVERLKGQSRGVLDHAPSS
jgi:hypothetical protein